MRLLIQRIDHQKCHGSDNGIILIGYNNYGYNILKTEILWHIYFGEKVDINVYLMFILSVSVIWDKSRENSAKGMKSIQQLQVRGLHGWALG